MMKIRVLSPLALFLLARSGFAVVTINADSTSVLAPSNGAPWDYVARLDNGFGARASGVYLGNRYVLTANHVDNDINLVHLDNADFTLDSSFTPLAITGTDMRLIRLAQDPGLPAIPVLGSSQASSAFNQPAVMIGYGVGKGTVAPSQGWNWGDDTTRVERWATNNTLGSYFFDQNSTPYLQTTFDLSVGTTEGQITGGDSGGGLFEKLGGVWTLVGINADVDTSNQALYDQNLTLAGSQPDHSYFASIAQFSQQIAAVVGPPALGGIILYWDGAGPAGDSVIQGGNGTWNATATNWTISSGVNNTTWQGGTAVFGGTAGTVTLSGTISAQGLIFNTTGYVIAGTSALTLAGTAPEIDVTNAGDSATISAPLAGTAGLTVGGAGKLILTNANNTYTGATTINAATLQIGTAAVAGKINAGSAVSVAQGGTLSLVNVNGNTFANNVSAGTGGGTLNVQSTNIVTLSGALTDNGTDQLSVAQSGTGTTILTNAHNTYSGATSVTAGNLQVGTTTAAGSIGANSAIALSNNSTLTLVNVFGGAVPNSVTSSSPNASALNVNSAGTVSLTGQLSGSLALSQLGTGTLTVSNTSNSYTGGTTLSAGKLMVNGSPVDGTGTPLGTGTLTIKGGTLGTSIEPTSSFTGSGTTLTNQISLLGNFSMATNVDSANTGKQNFTLNGNILLNGATRTITGVTDFGQGHFGGTIGAPGETAGLTYSATTTRAGDYFAFILDPTSVSNYTGLTTVNSGAILVFEGNTTDGAIRGNLDIEGTGSVDYIMGSSSAQQIADTATVTVNSTGTTISGMHFDGFELRGAKEIIGTLNGRGTVGLGGDMSGPGILAVGGGNFTGVIEDGAFASETGGALIKYSSGTLILSGHNTYTGVTRIIAGILQAGAVGALPSKSAFLINAASAIDLHNFNQSVGSIADDFEGSGGGLIYLGTATLTTGFDNSSTSFSGTIQGTGGLIKVGSGTLTLTGTNIYTGATTISGGTLVVNTAISSPVTNIGTAGTLAGTGTIRGNTTVTGGGIINLTSGGVINGILTSTGGNWNGQGAVLGVVTSSSGAFNINGNLTAAVGVNITGGTLGGTGTLTGLLNYPVLNYTSSASSTFGGVITAGAVTMNKAGSTLILTGTNTYAGSTSVLAGTLQIGNGTTGDLANTSAITVSGTGVLATNFADGTTFAKNVSLSATGASIKAIQAGTNTFSGVISGSGAFNQNGSGTTILPTAETYTGPTNVNAGTLQLDGSTATASVVNVATGGTLTGSGVINGKATVTGNGVINFGPGLGTIKGTLTSTGGNWNGQGEVDGLVTSSSGAFNINGDLAALSGVAITGGTFGGSGVLRGSLNYTSSANSTFGGIIVGGGAIVTMNKAGATLTLTGNSSNYITTNVLAGTLQIGNGVTGNLPGLGLITVSGTGTLATNLADGATFSRDVRLNAPGASLKAIQAGTNTLGLISGNGIFNQSGPGTTILNLAETFTGATNVNAGTLEVDGTLPVGNVVNVATGGTLTGTGTIIGNATMTGNGTINLNAGAILGTLAVTGGNWNGNGTVGGAVTASSGVFHLNGNLTDSAGVNVTGGTISGTGTLTGPLNYTSSSSSTFDGVVAGAGPVTMNKAGATLTLTGSNSYTGATNVLAGTLQLGNGTTGELTGTSGVTVSGTGVLATNLADQATFAQNISLTATGASVKAIQAGQNTFSGVIGGSGGFTQSGSGETILAGLDTYTGATNVTAGTLNIQGSLAAASVVNIGTAGTLSGAGTINGRATMTGNATSDFDGTIAGILGITSGNWTGNGKVNGLVTSSSGVFNLSGKLTAPAGLAVTGGSLTGNGKLTGKLTYTSSASSTFNGVVADGALPSSVTMNNSSATLTLVGQNFYTGGTTITAGTLALGNGIAPTASLGSSGVSINSNATLALNLASGSVFANNVTDNGHIADKSASGVHIVGSVITGTGNFLKTGAGEAMMNGANTYTGGTTISGGVLRATNLSGSATGTGTVAVNSGGTLAGNGTVSAIALNNGGIVAPGIGNGSAGATLHGSSLLWNAGGILEFGLGNSNSDKLALTGALTKGGTGPFVLKIDDLGIQQMSYTLLTFASTNFAQANFTLSLPTGYSGTITEFGTSLAVNITGLPVVAMMAAEAPISTEDATSEDDTSTGGSTVSGATLTLGNPETSSTTTTTTIAPSGSDLSGLTVSLNPSSESASTGTLVAAPEPTSVALLTLGALPLLGWRRRLRTRR